MTGRTVQAGKGVMRWLRLNAKGKRHASWVHRPGCCSVALIGVVCRRSAQIEPTPPRRICRRGTSSCRRSSCIRPAERHRCSRRGRDRHDHSADEHQRVPSDQRRLLVGQRQQPLRLGRPSPGATSATPTPQCPLGPDLRAGLDHARLQGQADPGQPIGFTASTGLIPVPCDPFFPVRGAGGATAAGPSDGARGSVPRRAEVRPGGRDDDDRSCAASQDRGNGRATTSRPARPVPRQRPRRHTMASASRLTRPGLRRATRTSALPAARCRPVSPPTSACNRTTRRAPAC